MTAAETWEGPGTPHLKPFAQTFGGPSQKAWRSVPYTLLGLSLLVLKAGPAMAWVTWAFSGGRDSRRGSASGQLGTPATSPHSSHPSPQADIRSRDYIRRTLGGPGPPAQGQER